MKNISLLFFYRDDFVTLSIEYITITLSYPYITMAPLIKTAVDKNNLTDSERKHIPFITISENTVTVSCGDGITHPMEDDHWIIFIELFKNGESVEKITLKKTDEPKAVFTVSNLTDTDTLSAHAFCNLHGIWESL